ncbi:MAG: MFS transporter [Halobacteriaceae archaeon]
MAVGHGRLRRALSTVDYRHRALALCAAAYFGTRLGQVAVGPLVPAMRDAFGVSTGAVGAATTGMWIAYALVQVPSGVLAARFGGRRVVLAALACAGVASAALAVAPTFAVVAVVVVGLGAGAGLYYNAGTALLDREFDAVGPAIGLHRVGGQAAGLLAPALVGLAVAVGGWRAGLSVGAAATVPVAAVAAVGLRRTPPAGGRSTTVAARVGPALDRLRRPPLRRVVAVATVGEFVGVAARTFLPAYLLATRSLGPGAVGALFAGYFLAVGGVQPLAGWVTERRSAATAAALALGAGAVGVGLLVRGPTLATAAGVALVGAASGVATPMQTAALSRVPDDDRAVGFGAFRTVYVLLGASGSLVCGVLVDLAGWDAAFAALGATLCVGVLVLGGGRGA